MDKVVVNLTNFSTVETEHFVFLLGIWCSQNIIYISDSDKRKHFELSLKVRLVQIIFIRTQEFTFERGQVMQFKASFKAILCYMHVLQEDLASLIIFFFFLSLLVTSCYVRLLFAFCKLPTPICEVLSRVSELGLSCPFHSLVKGLFCMIMLLDKISLQLSQLFHFIFYQLYHPGVLSVTCCHDGHHILYMGYCLTEFGKLKCLG